MRLLKLLYDTIVSITPQDHKPVRMKYDIVGLGRSFSGGNIYWSPRFKLSYSGKAMINISLGPRSKTGTNTTGATIHTYH